MDMVMENTTNLFMGERAPAVALVLAALWDEPQELDVVLRAATPEPWLDEVDESIALIDTLIQKGWVAIRRGLFCLTAAGRAHTSGMFMLDEEGEELSGEKFPW